MNATTATPMTWNTYKGHGFETGETFTYGGQARKAPAAAPSLALIERTSSSTLTLVDAEGGRLNSFGVATRFWASPDATLAATPEAEELRPLPVLAGKRSNGKADRSGDPRADRAARAAKATKKLAAAPAAKTPDEKTAATQATTERETFLSTARTAKNLDAAAKALAQAADLRPTRGELPAQGAPTAAPISATQNPETMEGTLRCYGACGRTLPAARFPFIANKGDGKGRYVECGACQTERLATNKARKAAGLEPIARPRADAEDIAAQA